MIQILASELYKAVKAVKTSNYSSLPVLNHARMRIDDESGYLTVTTTDLETPRTAKASCRWDDVLDVCVPMIVKTKNKVGYNRNAKVTTHTYYPFVDWLKVMAEYKELLTIELDQKTMTLKASTKNSRTYFKCMDAQEFPAC